MADLGWLVPTSGTWSASQVESNTGAGPTHAQVNEDPTTGMPDADYWAIVQSNGSYFAEGPLSDTPSDFDSMDTLTFEIYFVASGWSDDTSGIDLDVRDSVGTSLISSWSTIRNNSAANESRLVQGVFTLSSAGLSATKAQWDNAQVRISGTVARNMGADGGVLRIHALRIGGTYTATAASDSLTGASPATPTSASDATLTDEGADSLTGAATVAAAVATDATIAAEPSDSLTGASAVASAGGSDGSLGEPVDTLTAITTASAPASASDAALASAADSLAGDSGAASTPVSDGTLVSTGDSLTGASGVSPSNAADAVLASEANDALTGDTGTASTSAADAALGEPSDTLSGGAGVAAALVSDGTLAAGADSLTGPTAQTASGATDGTLASLAGDSLSGATAVAVSGASDSTLSVGTAGSLSGSSPIALAGSSGATVASEADGSLTGSAGATVASASDGTVATTSADTLTGAPGVTTAAAVDGVIGPNADDAYYDIYTAEYGPPVGDVLSGSTPAASSEAPGGTLTAEQAVQLVGLVAVASAIASGATLGDENAQLTYRISIAGVAGEARGEDDIPTTLSNFWRPVRPGDFLWRRVGVAPPQGLTFAKTDGVWSLHTRRVPSNADRVIRGGYQEPVTLTELDELLAAGLITSAQRDAVIAAGV